MDSDEPLDYLRLARVVVRARFQLPPHLIEDAIGQAVMAGWKATPRYDPDADGAMRFRGWVWMAMHHGVQDWLRTLYGRHGERYNINVPMSLDQPANEMAGEPDPQPLGNFIPDPMGERAYEAIEARETLLQLVACAQLTDKERYVVAGCLEERTLLDMARELGVTESRTCQIKLGAFQKMRRVGIAA